MWERKTHRHTHQDTQNKHTRSPQQLTVAIILQFTAALQEFLLFFVWEAVLSFIICQPRNKWSGFGLLNCPHQLMFTSLNMDMVWNSLVENNFDFDLTLYLPSTTKNASQSQCHICPFIGTSKHTITYRCQALGATEGSVSCQIITRQEHWMVVMIDEP